ncbi:MAG TPA: tripartite tricarboxylate transporter substrate binding protein [Pusillimonas sp.]|uniref:Bug family tripartite tricarboxylate transporter substrate binding protein n=1 Tax=unclassified Pusillimonas TaxID=2640016 RepID=UPI00260C2C6D|nr:MULTISPECIES: tripartite tricarboxylate transporter substrate binding protein [unclassified Pusillimonas]HLU20360.1 tripartite tricarboxylate transporter substrate binding protein [Pusillimonas sp.]
MNTATSFRRRSLLARGMALAALSSAALALSPLSASAQQWPEKPVTVIVNFPAGGAADRIARAITQPLSEVLGQSFVVENKGGAGGNIGGDAAAKSKPDGYTFLMSSGGMVSVNPLIYNNMTFDPMKDLVPVAAAARVLVFLETKPDIPANTVQEFIDYLKKHPGELDFGSPGNGSSPHLAGELFKEMAGVDAVHIPYRGAAPAMRDLLGGQIDFMFDPGIGLASVEAGKLKLLAIGSMQRSTRFPDVPTLHEAGLTNFDADTYFGFYAPAGTPPEIIQKMNTEINKIVESEDFRKTLAVIGAEPAPMTPDEFHQKAVDDAERFGKLIKERQIMGG